MKANKTMLIAALAAGSLLVWSPALRADDTNTPPSTPPAGAPPAGQHSPGMRGGPNLDQLNLTDDQKPKVQAIVEAQREKMRELRQDTSLTPEDRRAKAKAIRADTDAKMKDVLTPEQFEKWQKMPAMGMRDRRNGPPPGGNPPPAGTPPPASTPPPAAAPQQ
jgi:Spy/CpxP family protein refolding chaperone